MPMTTHEAKPHDAGVLKVCIHALGQGDFTGELYSRYLPQAVGFVGVAAMLTKMEQIMDLLGYPQRYRQSRSFSATPASRAGQRKSQEIVRCLDETDFLQQAGMCATFVVQIVFRQNATWQGSIVWSETGKSQQFSSTLEMIKLMDNAVEQQAPGRLTEMRW